MADTSAGRSLSAAWSWWGAIVSGPIAALLGLYFVYRTAVGRPVAAGDTLSVTIALFLVAFVVSILVGWRVEWKRAEALKSEVVALIESQPRIVYVGQRGSPLTARVSGTDGHHKEFHFYLLHIQFKNRPICRVGERSIARHVSATVEYWEEKRDQLITRFQGRWPVTSAAEHVGYDRTEPITDFEANEYPVKLNLAVIPVHDGRVYAASEENFHAYPGGDHPAHRINPLQDENVVRVCVKLRGSNVNQDFWFTMRHHKNVNPLSGRLCLEMAPTSGEFESEFLVS